ncbi:MAG: N-formylglutamate deformylase [Woeseiaceae bacterium]|nr:N-formylglutamate deformylase [Woeseiaceae bacterium]
MSDDVLEFRAGDSPLLISIPHDGREVPAEIAARMTGAGRTLPDTDWHVARLYDFAATLGAGVIAARFSRYVIDLNRPADDSELYPGQVATGLCPARTFRGDPVYRDGEGVSAAERQARVETYWRPYHDRLAHELGRLQARHGYALLWDAHSIASEVPALFDGPLTELNLGTYGGASVAVGVEKALWEVAAAAPFSAVLNGRFTGGYITRHYGRPDDGCHAVQLELAQRSYMDEKTLRYDAARAEPLRAVLRELLQTFLRTVSRDYSS